MISAEQVRERIAKLERDMQSALNNVQAIYGAIQDSKYWLSLIEAERDDPHNNEG